MLKDTTYCGAQVPIAMTVENTRSASGDRCFIPPAVVAVFYHSIQVCLILVPTVIEQMHSGFPPLYILTSRGFSLGSEGKVPYIQNSRIEWRFEGALHDEASCLRTRTTAHVVTR